MTTPRARPIETYCLGIFDGPHATPKESDDGPVYLGIRNITDHGSLDLSDIRHVAEEEYERWTRRVTPEPGDVVFTYEATLHRYAMIPDGFRGCLGRRVALVRPDPRQVDSRFLVYFFLSHKWRQIIERNIVTGATVDRIPIERFPSFSVALPLLPNQQRIADILSAYDDLIENNKRRMRLLEDAARQLFQEWFVRLRFPGREHTPVVDGVPVGWRRAPLGDVARFLSGGTPAKSNGDFWQGGIPWVSSGELTAMRIGRTSLNITPEAIEQGSRLVPAGTILAVVRGMSLAKDFRISVTSREVAFNQDLKAVVPIAPLDSLYLFHALDAQRPQIRDRAGEASHGTKKLDTAVLASTRLLVPTPMLQEQFGAIASGLHAQWDNLDQQINKLRAARDLLLPRLMSGEIAV